MHDIRWFAPNAYAALVVPAIRRLTAIESVASGTPVVASDIPPHREFVGVAARFFPLDDIDALAESVESALCSGGADPVLMTNLSIPAAAERFGTLLRPLLH